MDIEPRIVASDSMPERSLKPSILPNSSVEYAIQDYSWGFLAQMNPKRLQMISEKPNDNISPRMISEKSSILRATRP